MGQSSSQAAEKDHTYDSVSTGKKLEPLDIRVVTSVALTREGASAITTASPLEKAGQQIISESKGRQDFTIPDEGRYGLRSKLFSMNEIPQIANRLTNAKTKGQDYR